MSGTEIAGWQTLSTEEVATLAELRAKIAAWDEEDRYRTLSLANVTLLPTSVSQYWTSPRCPVLIGHVQY
eukprot:3520140-Rhodomonas_salina.1